MAAQQERVRLVHITTVPESLYFLRGQAAYAKSRGFEVHALSSPGEVLDRFGADVGVPTYGVPMPRRITPLSDLAAISATYRRLRMIRPHIVHAHTPKGGLLGTAAARLARVPVRIYHIHGLPLLTAAGSRRAILRLSETTASRLAHQVLCVSESVRGIVVDKGLCPPEKIKVLVRGSVGGVDARQAFNPERVAAARAQTRNQYGIPPDAAVVGFLGRLVPDKGLVELARAWESLRDEHPTLHMLLVGPKEPHDPLPAEVEEALERDERVHLTGLQWDTPPMYAAMDVVVLPSHREGFPSVPLEAAAMELPVVASRVPGCVDAVKDGETGALVPPADAAALAEAVHSYLISPELRRAHGRSGRERVLRDFRPEDVWEATFNEYCRLLESR